MSNIPDLCNAWSTYSIKGNGDILECCGWSDGGRPRDWHLDMTRYDFSDMTPFDISKIRGVISFDDWDEEVIPIKEYFNDSHHYTSFYILGKFPNGEPCVLKLMELKDETA